MAITITAENGDDRTPVLDLVGEMFSKLFGDRGYISAKLITKLTEQGIHFITRIKKNMQNILIH